jgi:hypothetical protein
MLFILTPDSWDLLFPTYHILSTTYVFSFQQHSRFLLESPLLSITFPLLPAAFEAGPLFSITFPLRSFRN